MVEPLGEAQFQEIWKDASEGNIPEAVRLLEQYRDEAGSCVKALDARKIDAEKHPSGFKQLQFSLQEALRRLDEIVAGLTADQQPGFSAVRSDLQKMNDHLVQELFPRRPAVGASPEKSNP
jgi:hypothetical protein